MKKILILQTREPELADYEREMIIQRTGKPASYFATFNLLSNKSWNFTADQLSHVIMSGSSKCVSDGRQPWWQVAEQVIHDCEAHDIPFLGICFGMQFLATAMGGRVIKDKAKTEMGAVEIVTHDTQDTFFSFLPPRFKANQVHEDFVVELPPKFANLGHSQVSPIQIIAHESKPLFGFQFHPEHNQGTVRHYLKFYSGKYADSSKDEAIVSSMIEPGAAIKQILPRFLQI